jgi:NIPSNAP/TAT (twin-arginine translocation) pathway signal sequence
MERRDFLKSGLAATVAASVASAAPAASNLLAAKDRDYYEIRAYRLHKEGPPALLHTYLEKAFLPALATRGISNVGVFTELDSPESPAVWVVIPHGSLESVVSVNAELNADEELRAAAGEYWTTPTKDRSAFDRMASWLHLAFAGMPRLAVPALSARKADRIFELRTYESFNEERALKKVAMFNAGEIDVMREVGLGPVFFGQGLIGHGLPHLTYMLSAADRESHADHWKAFSAHPVWNQLKNDPAYNETVSKIISRFLAPTPYSAI